MEQALATLRSYDLDGIRFDFDKATIRRDTAPLLNDIAVTLKNNPFGTWNIIGQYRLDWKTRLQPTTLGAESRFCKGGTGKARQLSAAAGGGWSRTKRTQSRQHNA